MATFFPPRLWPARISAGQSAERLPIFHSSSSSTHTLFVFFFYPVGKSGFGRGRKKRFREANLVCESRKNRADYGPRHPAGTETAGTWGIASFFFAFFFTGGQSTVRARTGGHLHFVVWSGPVCLSGRTARGGEAHTKKKFYRRRLGTGPCGGRKQKKDVAMWKKSGEERRRGAKILSFFVAAWHSGTLLCRW